jgi:PAS domain S-box-containing protein
VQERYRLIAENTADVIWLLDLEAGKFVYCSPSVEKLRGYSAAEVLGQRLADAMPPADADRAERDLRERIGRFAAGDRTVLSQTDEVDQFRRDGSLVPTEIVTTLLPDAAGRITRVLGVARDITERKRALAALRERDLRYRAELENDVAARTAELAARNREVQALLLAVPDMVMRLRPDGTVLYRQPARGARGARLLASADEPLPADLLPPCLALGRRALAGEDAVVGEADLALPESPVSVELRAAAVGPDEFVVFVRDITARKRLQAEIAANLEKERQISEMKTRFISVTSHEFRTPMAAAMGSAELLANHLDRLAPAKRQELFARIKTSLLRMTDMLDDVLTLNRIDAKRTPVQPAPTDLHAVLRNLVDEIRVGDRDAHRFALEAPAGAAPFVTDPTLFQHIVSNLLSNAVRYSPPGTVVTVQLAFAAAGAHVSVSDQGIGIPEADRDRIFEPFERGTNVGTIKGTGLGLNIVKRMTELLGGTIAVAPAPGGGTCFTLDLPALSPDSGAAR